MEGGSHELLGSRYLALQGKDIGSHKVGWDVLEFRSTLACVMGSVSQSNDGAVIAYQHLELFMRWKESTLLSSLAVSKVDGAGYREVVLVDSLLCVWGRSLMGLR